MIEFQTVPDPIFLAIMHDALEYVRDAELVQFREGIQPTPSEEKELDAFYATLYPELVPYFSRRQLIEVIELLLTASRATTLYRLTDYHWLVLYRCLEMFCDLHNDEALGSDEVGPYVIDKIDFGYILDRFFFDTDFLFGGELIVASEKNLQSVPPGVSSQARTIAAGAKPDPNDLEPMTIAPSESLAEATSQNSVPMSDYIGPYPMR